VSPVIIRNQCSNFELASPAYFGYHTIWNIQPDQKGDVNAMISASFVKEAVKREFENALIYKLQKKKSIESGSQSKMDNTSTEDTSTSIQLLVIWKSDNSHEFPVRALLIKHNNTTTWCEDTLEKLHSMYPFLFKDNPTAKDTWLLDDATVLMIMLKWEKQTRTIKIAISDGTRDDDSMGPLWVPSNM
jgi:hypothetical protein